jgi:ligand-binding sensor domain-containing protein
MRRIGSLLGFLLCALLPLQAQPGRWQAYTAMRQVNTLTASRSTLWAGTTGGLFAYELATGEVRRFTRVEGMSGIEISALLYDERRNRLWVGYPNGVLDVWDETQQRWRTILDIARSTQFTQRGVRSFFVYGDTLYVATDFGIVLLDSQGRVRDSYTRLGTLNPGTPVWSVLIAAGRIWAATDFGVASAPLAAPNLKAPEFWELHGSGCGLPSGRIYALADYENTVYAATSGGLARYDGSCWRLLPLLREPVVALSRQVDYLFVLTPSAVARLDPALAVSRFPLSPGEPRALWAQSPTIWWVGDFQRGLCRYEGGQLRWQFIPEGPYSNLISQLSWSPRGLLWAASSQLDRPGSGFYRFDGTRWTNFHPDLLPELAGIFDVPAVLADPDGGVWAGTWGRGIVRVEPDGTLRRFDRRSGLIGIPGSEDYVVVPALSRDPRGRIWAVSFLSSYPLFVYENGRWTGLPRHSQAPGNATYFTVYADSSGLLWIGLRASDDKNVGMGLLVLDTRDTPENPADDRALYLRAERGAGNLPDRKVNAIVQDRRGMIWIGTARGLAYYPFPGLLIEGSTAEREAQWPVSADTGQGRRSYLLRELSVNAIAIDGANRKWIGSPDGLWVTDEAVSRLLAHYTTENSPLLSNNILGLAYRPDTGELFVATSAGLVSIMTDVLGPEPELRTLRIFPNPGRLQGPRPIYIRGLTEETRIKILSIEGHLVRELYVRGGQAIWDGRDTEGRLVPSGVYLITAVDLATRRSAVGKVLIIR